MRKKHLPFLFAIIISSCFTLRSQSNLWGVTTNGGNGAGSLFNLPAGGTSFTSQYNFTDNSGSAPTTNKLLEVNSKLYGMTGAGGANNTGVLFEYDPILNTYTKKMDFALTTSLTTGSQPAGSLIQASSNGKLYGLTKSGGPGGFGTLFEYLPSTNAYSVAVAFTGITGAAMGNQATGSLLEASNGKLYGMTSRGGTGGSGTGNGLIFEFNPVTGTYSVLASFTGATGAFQGSVPLGSLIEGALGKLYGVTSTGGANNVGVIFEYDINTFTYTKLVDLSSANGTGAQSALLRASNGKLYGTTSAGGTGSGGVIFEYDLSNAAYLVDVNLFSSTAATVNGFSSYSTLLQASNGKLYGTARGGGANSAGVVYEYDIASGIYTKKVDLLTGAPTGSFPQSSFMQFSGNGKLYALASQGGINAQGTIMEYDFTTNTLTKKLDLNNSTGGQPHGAPVLASNNKLYGVTAFGGLTLSSGVIYEYDPAISTYAKKVELVTANGRSGYGALVQHSNGNLYGLMSAGGSNNLGTLIQYSPGTTAYIKLVDFSAANGAMPYGSLVLASNGNFYGMTTAGGTNNVGVIFEYNVTTSTYTVKYNFVTATGASPFGSLYIASNGKAYGMTSAGGANGNGVIFEYDITIGTYTKKIDLALATGGSAYGSLVQANGNLLYGMTRLGGSNGLGTIFEYDFINNTYTKKADLSATSGDLPYGSLAKTASGKLYGLTTAGGANSMGTMFEFDPATATFTKKMDLSVTTGGSPGYTQLLEICTLPSAASAITATTNAVCNADATPRSFSISTIANATSYTTTVPSGAVITSGNTTNAVNINFGSLAAGVYTVTIGGTNVCGTGTLSAKTITVNALPTVSVNSGTICSGSSFSITPSGASTYTIQGGSANVAPGTSTNYTVNGTDGNGCSALSPVTASVTVNTSPNISVNSGSVCNGSSFTISPTGANTYTIEGGNAIITPGATTTYTVIGTALNGCASTSPATSSITVYNHPTISAPSGSICSGNTFTVSPSGAGSYNITGGSFNVSPATTINYTVTGTSVQGCSSANAVTVTVTVYATPTVAVNSGSICSGNSFTISPTGADSYTVTGNNFIVSPATNTTYVVIGSSTAGCTSGNAATATVTVYATPVVSATSGSLCSGNTFSITPGGASSYTITGNSFMVSPATTTNYFVTGMSAQGCPSSNTATSTITVYTTPTIGVNSGSICSGQSFTITPTGAAAYTISGGSSVVSPATNTNYFITGKSTAGCMALNTATSVVTVSLTPTVTATSGTICAGSSFSITPGGASTYTVQGNSFVVSPLSTSTYTLIGKAANGCTSGNTATSTVVVNANPTITVNSGTICAGSQFTLTPGGGDSYTISAGNATLVSPATNTIYTVTGTLLGCPGVNTATASVGVNALPNITINTNSICIGATASLVASGGVTYTWMPSASGATITPAPLANTAYSVTGTDASGCSASATATVVVNPLPTILVAGGAVCPGESFTLQPSGAVTYTYSGGSDIVTPVATTDYSVTGTDVNGCTSTVSAVASITVTSQLPVSISGLSSVCSGQAAVLTAGGASTYSWSTGAAISTITVSPTSQTSYTVVGSSGSCSNVATFTISTLALPNVQISSTSGSEICLGETVTLTAAGADSYTWSTGQNVGAITVAPQVSTTYVLTGADATCTNSATYAQSVSTCIGIKTVAGSEAVFSVYPNPNTGEFSVEVPEAMSISILNTLGSVVLTQQLQAGKNTVNLEKQAKGIYFVQAVYNKHVKTIRVAVQ